MNPPHSNNHPYRIIVPSDETGPSSGWSAEEDLLLLNAIEINGPGNWPAISQHVMTKSHTECEEHYFAMFVDDSSKAEGVAVGKHAGHPVPEQTPSKLGNEFAGYHPKRGDFEIEYDNETEINVQDLVFYPDDTELDRSLKLAMLDIYSGRLKKRQELKSLARQIGLFDDGLAKALAAEPDVAAEVDLVKPFAKFFQPSASYREFVDDLFKIREIEREIVRLQEIRRAGITQLADVPKYDEAKRKRARAKRGSK